MAEVETSSLEDVACLWVSTGYDQFGQATVSDQPCEILVKWNDSLREQGDPQSNRVGYDATAVVDRYIGLGSLMWLGRLRDWPAYAASLSAGRSPVSEETVMEVTKYSRVKDIRGRAAYREVGLMRYKRSLPASAIGS